MSIGSPNKQLALQPKYTRKLLIQNLAFAFTIEIRHFNHWLQSVAEICRIIGWFIGLLGLTILLRLLIGWLVSRNDLALKNRFFRVFDDLQVL